MLLCICPASTWTPQLRGLQAITDLSLAGEMPHSGDMLADMLPLMTSLQRLMLGSGFDAKIAVDALGALGAAPLKALHLRDVELGNTELQQVQSALCKLRQLDDIVLDSNGLGAQASGFFDGLATLLPQLSSICISRNRLEGGGAAALAAALHRAAALRSLRLPCNELDGSDAELLADALPAAAALTELSLSGNPLVGAAGAWLLILSAPVCPTLKVLDLCGINVTSAAQRIQETIDGQPNVDIQVSWQVCAPAANAVQWRIAGFVTLKTTRDCDLLVLRLSCTKLGSRHVHQLAPACRPACSLACSRKA